MIDVGEDDLTIECDSHGSVPWHGHVICSACDRVHGAKSSLDLCECGRRLWPLSHPLDDEFTARAICAACYSERMAPKMNFIPA